MTTNIRTERWHNQWINYHNRLAMVFNQKPEILQSAQIYCFFYLYRRFQQTIHEKLIDQNISYFQWMITYISLIHPYNLIFVFPHRTHTNSPQKRNFYYLVNVFYFWSLIDWKIRSHFNGLFLGCGIDIIYFVVPMW